MKPANTATATNSDMRLGAIFPQTDIGIDPQEIARYATTIEQMGFKHLLAFDHVIGGDLDTYPQLAGRYTSESNFHEVFVLFGYLAALTTRLEFATGVVILPQRQTALVAKQAAALDVLSGGRFRMGVGIGWNQIEYQALGENFRNRARRMEEQIEFLRTMWRESVIDFDGEFHTIQLAGIKPLPVNRSIPIWIGASAEPAVRRAARIADGFMATTLPGEELDAILSWIRDELANQGRSQRDFGLDGRILLTQGNEDDWKRTYTFWQETGATHLSLHTMRGGLQSVDQHLNLLERALRAIEGL